MDVNQQTPTMPKANQVQDMQNNYSPNDANIWRRLISYALRLLNNPFDTKSSIKRGEFWADIVMLYFCYKAISYIPIINIIASILFDVVVLFVLIRRANDANLPRIMAYLVFALPIIVFVAFTVSASIAGASLFTFIYNGGHIGAVAVALLPAMIALFAISALAFVVALVLFFIIGCKKSVEPVNVQYYHVTPMGVAQAKPYQPQQPQPGPYQSQTQMAQNLYDAAQNNQANYAPQPQSVQTQPQPNYAQTQSSLTPEAMHKRFERDEEERQRNNEQMEQNAANWATNPANPANPISPLNPMNF